MKPSRSIVDALMKEARKKSGLDEQWPPKRPHVLEPAAKKFKTEDGAAVPRADVNQLLASFSRADIEAVRASYVPNSNLVNRLPGEGRARLDTGTKNDKHDYYYDDRLLTSRDGWYGGSSIGELLFAPFDREGIGRTIAKNRLVPKEAREAAKAKGQTVVPTEAEIEAMKKTIHGEWDAARDRGTVRHWNYDDFLQGAPLTDEMLDEMPIGYFRFLRDRPWLRPWRTELTLASEVLKLKGQIDIIFLDMRTNKLILADWKNCGKDLTKQYRDEVGEYRRGRHPITINMLETGVNKYSWQVCGAYALLLETIPLPYELDPTALIVNFDPSTAKRAREEVAYFLHEVPIAPFREALRPYLPWKPDDPRHTDFSQFPTQHARAPMEVMGPTRRVKIQRGPRPSDLVWVCNSNKNWELPASPWRHPWKWFPDVPPGAASYYEWYLLNHPSLFIEVHTLYGKMLACWCPADENGGCTCHASVLVRYANWSEGRQLLMDMTIPDCFTGGKKE
jgi:hypothetical protein